MRLRIAKVHQHPIAEVLGDIAVESLDHLSSCGLVGPDHLPVVLRIELACEDSGVCQVTEQHRELTALGVWGVRCGGSGVTARGLISVGSFPVGRWGGDRRRGRARASGPHQHVTILVHHSGARANKWQSPHRRSITWQEHYAYTRSMGEWNNKFYRPTVTLAWGLSRSSQSSSRNASMACCPRSPDRATP